MTERHAEYPISPGYARPPGSRIEKAMMAAAIVVGIAGLTWLGSKVSGPDRDSALEPQVGRNHLQYSEVATLFVPTAFLELANDPAASLDIASDHAIRLLLRRRGGERAWYAVATRGYQASGPELMMITYARPFQNSAKRLEFRQVLETLAGMPPRDQLVDYSTAEVRIIPAHLESAEPATAIEELLNDSTRSAAGLPGSAPR